MAINLLPEKVRRERKKGRVKQVSTFGMVAVLVGVAAISLGIFIFKLVLDREIENLEDQIENQRRRIKAREELEIKVRSLGEKVKALGDIFEKEEHYSFLLEELSSILPSEITLADLKVNSPTLAEISGTASSYVDLARFLEVAGVSEGEVFTGAKLRSVNLDAQTGRVRFRLDLVVGKGVLHGD